MAVPYKGKSPFGEGGTTMSDMGETKMDPRLPPHIQVAMKIEVLSFKALDMIDTRELKRLLTMIESPDQDTHQVLRELIANKKKEIENGQASD